MAERRVWTADCGSSRRPRGGCGSSALLSKPLKKGDAEGVLPLLLLFEAKGDAKGTGYYPSAAATGLE
eukprot:COSAG01_NODE_3548_length_5952_cov_7.082564_1_plen_68_part_00